MYKIEIDTRQLRRAMDRAVEYMEQKSQPDAAPEIIGWIQARTAIGKSVKGRQFKPYTPRYAAVRHKEHLETSHVNLWRSGKMLDGLHYARSQKSIVPTSEAAGRAKGHQFGYAKKNLPARPFLGVTGEEGKLIGKDLAVKLRSYMFKH